MKNNTYYPKLNGILIGITLFLLTAIGFYIYDLDSKYCKSKSEIVKNNKLWNRQLTKLKDLRYEYNLLLQENIEYKDDIKTARDETLELIAELSDSKKGSISETAVQKKINQLENRLRMLIAENSKLKKTNTFLVFQNDSTSKILAECQKMNSSFVQKAPKNAYFNSISDSNKDYYNKPLKVESLKITPYKIKNSGQHIVTDVARKTNKINVLFTVAENPSANSGIRNYYIQIVYENGVVLDEKEVFIGNTNLKYTIKSEFDFQNETIDVSEDIMVDGLIKGSYSVNLFCEDLLVSEMKFNLF
jgi:hypothetical protein